MKISTPDLCDEHGDEVQVAAPVLKHFGGVRQFGGAIATVKCFEDNSKVGEMLKADGKGRVLLVDGGASPRRSLLGDRLVTQAVENNWAGIIVYGYIRDVEDIETMPIGVMAMGTIPRKTCKRGEGRVNIDLDVAGLKASPGNYIYADGSGVILSEKSLL